jgi:S-adenosylmethionine synthetase
MPQAMAVGFPDEEFRVARSEYLFTSESVSEGHPDKVCDRISDEVVDLYYRTTIAQGLDVWSLRCAAETLATTNKVVIAGEFRGTDAVTKDLIAHHARMAIKDIGYDQAGFSWRDADIEVLLHGQSEHIAQGVDASGNKEEGAGDQGIMFGYACDETPALMPATLQYSHDILKKLAEVRHSGECSVLEPDAKSQVTVRYEDGRPVEILQIVVSTQHKKRVGLHMATPKRIEALIRPYVESVLPSGLVTKKTKWHVNPTGRFEIGGPDGDAGLTGRKIIVDTYGGAAPHGGGAFSGKDPTKVDRSAAYACRYLAKNVVASGLARKCTIQISYAIGVAQPLSFYVDLHGTGEVDPAKLEAALPQLIGGATPRAIREHLQLNRPIYARTAAYGHFGRQPDNEGGFSWEKTDLADQIRGLA